MIIKYIFIFFLAILLIISISQIFSIPPFEDDIFSIYKSGYFNELEKEFKIIKESFIGIKTMSKPVYAWIFLEDIEKQHYIDINVYDRKGLKVIAPGENHFSREYRVREIINSLNPDIYSEIKRGRYYCAIPILIEDRCKFCHNNDKGNIIGVITFEREFDSYIYYSSERIIIFVIISTLLSILFYFTLRWDPEKRVKELFDKM